MDYFQRTKIARILVDEKVVEDMSTDKTDTKLQTQTK